MPPPEPMSRPSLLGRPGGAASPSLLDGDGLPSPGPPSPPAPQAPGSVARDLAYLAQFHNGSRPWSEYSPAPGAGRRLTLASSTRTRSLGGPAGLLPPPLTVSSPGGPSLPHSMVRRAASAPPCHTAPHFPSLLKGRLMRCPQVGCRHRPTTGTPSPPLGTGAPLPGSQAPPPTDEAGPGTSRGCPSPCPCPSRRAPGPSTFPLH